jgi:malate permease and related proteins
VLNVVLSLGIIVVIGAALRYLVPSLDVEQARKQIGTIVLNVLLPALNVQVIYQATFDSHLWQIPVVMLAGAAVCLGCALLVFRFFSLDPRVKSPLILGCAFGNVTYLGMPLLRGLFPHSVLDVTEVAVLCEITVTTADLIAGTLLAMHYRTVQTERPMRESLRHILKFPLIWSVAITALIRVVGIELPAFVLSASELLAQAASGLMLLVLGMAIRPPALLGALRKFRLWWPMLVIKLGVSVAVVAALGTAVGLSPLHLEATTIESAMPPQFFILVIADRFRFDTEIFAPAVVFLTISSLLIVPLTHDLIT